MVSVVPVWRKMPPPYCTTVGVGLSRVGVNVRGDYEVEGVGGWMADVCTSALLPATLEWPLMMTIPPQA